MARISPTGEGPGSLARPSAGTANVLGRAMNKMRESRVFKMMAEKFQPGEPGAESAGDDLFDRLEEEEKWLGSIRRYGLSALWNKDDDDNDGDGSGDNAPDEPQTKLGSPKRVRAAGKPERGLDGSPPKRVKRGPSAQPEPSAAECSASAAEAEKRRRAVLKEMVKQVIIR